MYGISGVGIAANNMYISIIFLEMFFHVRSIKSIRLTLAARVLNG